jgi:putative transposase
MAAGVIQVGQRFKLADAMCRIMRSVGKDLWAIENLSDGRLWETSTSDLLSKWERAELQFPGSLGKSIPSTAEQIALKEAATDAFMQSYPTEVLQLAKAKLAFVRRLRFVPMTAITVVPLIQEIWSDKALWKGQCIFKKCPHFTTIAAWIRRYRAAGDDIRALADKHHTKGTYGNRYEQELEDLADDVVETAYLVLERQSIAACLEILQGRVAKLNQTRLPSEQLRIPTYSYLKRKISRLPSYDVCVARFGKQVADIRFRAAGKGAIAEAPLARASMDHCRLDVIVVDDATGLPLGRPWLTLILDECTRYILGYYIGFEEPSNVSVARALRNALMPKTQMLKCYPSVVNTWDAWGVIHTLIVDNGLEFHGDAIEHGAGTFGIVIQFCPRRKPWYKGKIERLFGTINSGLLAGMPGRTFSNVLEKGDYDPLKHAVVGLETLRETVFTWIVDVYHQKIHRGLGRTPAQAWHEAIQLTDRWLPASSTVLDSAFSRRDTRQLTHKGIEFDSLLYNSNDMRVLREQHGHVMSVEVRVMDDDLGHVFVVAPDGQTVIKVPALEPDYAMGMTRWQHKICRRYQRRMQDDQARQMSLGEAKERIRRLIREDARRGKRVTRNRQARFNEQSYCSTSGEHLRSPGAAMVLPAPPLLNTQSVNLERKSISYPALIESSVEVPVMRGRRRAVINTEEASYES